MIGKHIIDTALNNSLILGDEICRGTEDLSAISLVGSLLNELSKRKISLIFTTHLHKLPELTLVKHLKNIEFYHLTIDIVDEKIIYLRKLEKGSGGNIYGLEIAKNIINNNNFILTAIDIRNELLNETGHILNVKSSSYNNEVLMDKCCIPGCDEKGDETHHIKFQKDANENGFINHIHKNNKSNLIVLCEKHHNDVHSNKLIINGYKETTEGKELDYSFCKEIIKHKKYNDEIVKNIIGFLQSNNITKITDFDVNRVKKKFDINICKSTLVKIFKNEY